MPSSTPGFAMTSSAFPLRQTDDLLGQGGVHRRRGWRSSPFVGQFVRNRAALVAFAFFVVLIVVAFEAPRLAPYNPTKVQIVQKLKSPSREHWLGTDQFGRDVWSRLL